MGFEAPYGAEPESGPAFTGPLSGGIRVSPAGSVKARENMPLACFLTRASFESLGSELKKAR